MARIINEIILHCSATKEGLDYKAKDIDKWHKAQGFKCIGYNFVITLNGTVETGRDINDIPAHCTGHNKNSIGIVYIGGCDKNMKAKDTRTESQKLSLYKLVKELMIKYHIDITSVHTHNEFAQKACPSFSIYTFRNEFLTWLNGKQEETKKKVKCPHYGMEIDEELLRSI